MPEKIVQISALERFLDNIKTYIGNLLDDKQDTLVDGDTIKTINGISILGTGDLSINANTMYTSDGVSVEENIIDIKNTVDALINDDTNALIDQTIAEILKTKV